MSELKDESLDEVIGVCAGVAMDAFWLHSAGSMSHDPIHTENTARNAHAVKSELQRQMAIKLKKIFNRLELITFTILRKVLGG